MNPPKQSRNVRRSERLLEAAGYSTIRVSGEGWNLIAVGSVDLALVRVTRDSLTIEQREDLASFSCPPNCRKLIHVWRRRERFPDVMTL